VFAVRYELNLYILFRRNSVFKGLSPEILEYVRAVNIPAAILSHVRL
jgi:hypothetical protein